MAEVTQIEWCDATLNLWWGCTKVSDGCKFCYADALSNRYKRAEWGPTGTRTEVKTWRSTLNKISKRAKSEGRRLRVFCQSMSDTFEGPETMGGVDSENWKLVDRLQWELFRRIEDHPELDFLLLTKRPQNVKPRFRQFGFSIDGSLPPNLWMGTSVEDQKTADERIPHLLNIPAKVRFLSCEPLLGPLDLVSPTWAVSPATNSPTIQGYLRDESEIDDWRYWIKRNGIHWVICGGESGPSARPMNPEWARSLRDQCVKAQVPFHFKQWGGRNKKEAGRILDGRTWDEFPEANPNV